MTEEIEKALEYVCDHLCCHPAARDPEELEAACDQCQLECYLKQIVEQNSSQQSPSAIRELLLQRDQGGRIKFKKPSIG